MLRIFIFFGFVFLLLGTDIYSQQQGYNIPARKKREKKEQVVFVPDYELMFSFSYHTSSGFFDKDGDLITNLPDSLSVEGLTRIYTFDLKRYSFELDFKYFASEKLTLSARAPLTFYFLDEIFTEYIDYEKQVAYPREFKDQFSHVRVDFIGLSATYALFDAAFINRYFAEVRIPTGFVDGVRNDDREFWSDGALEITPGFVVGTSSDKVTLEVGAKYNYRAEDMTDRVMGNLNFALHTVPGTRFYGFLEGALNVGMGDNDIIEEVFNIRRMPWQDEYLDTGFGFKIAVDQQYLGDFSYRIRLAGRNAWNHAIYFINFGLRF